MVRGSAAPPKDAARIALDITWRNVHYATEMSNTPNLTHAQEAVTLRHGKPVADLLREMYVDKGMSLGAIANELGITRFTVAMWLREFSIKRPEAA